MPLGDFGYSLDMEGRPLGQMPTQQLGQMQSMPEQRLGQLSQSGDDPQQEQPQATGVPFTDFPDSFNPMMPMGPGGVVPHMLANRYIQQPYEDNQTADAVQQNKPLLSMLTDIIRQKESTNNYQAVNPKSSASGAYQYTDGTWNGYGGYARAALAPKEVQDRRFGEDIANRLAQFGGDPFKAIAAHYLPALANDPTRWNQPFRVGGRVVNPVNNYVQYVVRGTPLEKEYQQYIALHGNNVATL